MDRLTCTHMNVSWPASPVSPPVTLRQARAGSKADEDAPCSQSFKIPKRLHRQAACSVHAREGAANQRLRLAASRCRRREGRINSARAIREVTSREPRLGGSLSNRLRLGLDGRRASLMEMSALLRKLPQGNSAVRALRWANP